MSYSALPSAAPFSDIASGGSSSLQLEETTILDLFQVEKDNYLRKTGALVIEKATGIK